MVWFCSCTCVVFVLAVLNILRMGLAYKNFVHRNCSLYVWSSLSELRFYEDVYNALAYTHLMDTAWYWGHFCSPLSVHALYFGYAVSLLSQLSAFFFHPYFGLLSQRPAALKAALLQHVRLFLGLMRKVLGEELEVGDYLLGDTRRICNAEAGGWKQVPWRRAHWQSEVGQKPDQVREEEASTTRTHYGPSFVF